MMYAREDTVARRVNDKTMDTQIHLKLVLAISDPAIFKHCVVQSV